MEANAHQIPERGPENPPELTEVTILPTREEQAELEVVRRLRMILDEAVALPGTRVRFGLDAVLGLIPGVGDLGSAAIGAYLIRAASRLGVPAIVQARMLLNLVIDAIIGLVPIVGDYLDVLYKANAKNAALIEHAVANRETVGRSSWFVFVAMLLGLTVVVVGAFVGTLFVLKRLWEAL